MVVLGVLLLAVAFGAWRLSQPRTTVPVFNYVVYDDFAFKVIDAKREPGLDQEHDRFVLTVECQNRAKRVPFTFKPDMVEVRGNSEKLPKAKDSWSQAVELSAGQSTRRTVVVTGSSSMTDLRVWFRTGGDFGDFMDGLLDENFEIKVPVR